MLNLNLDEESEKYLIEILAHEQTTSSELVKQLLRDRWQSLQPRQTTLERMGRYPEPLLSGSPDLSDRDVRKKLIVDHIQKRHDQQR